MFTIEPAVTPGGNSNGNSMRWARSPGGSKRTKRRRTQFSLVYSSNNQGPTAIPTSRISRISENLGSRWMEISPSFPTVKVKLLGRGQCHRHGGPELRGASLNRSLSTFPFIITLAMSLGSVHGKMDGENGWQPTLRTITGPNVILRTKQSLLNIRLSASSPQEHPVACTRLSARTAPTVYTR